MTTGSAAAGTVAAAPLISVLVPCWNAERTLERALDSVLEERAVPIECVVVDDASTDRTAEVALAIARRDDRVRVIRLPENGGVSNARNRGLEEIRGSWLTMLDADDRFVPGGFGALARAAVASDARAVVGQQIWTDGRRRWRTALYDIPDITRAGRKSLAENPGLLYSVSPHAKLFHRSCFEGLQFTGRVLGDQPWIIRALLRAGNKIDVLAETVYEWHRPAAGSDTHSITSATRSSVQGGVAAAGVAAGAFAAVAEESARRLDATQSAVVLGTYVERLLRSDLGRHLSMALARGDPEIGQLLHAIRDFLLEVPPPYLAASDALARDILEPPLRKWRSLDPEGREALRELANLAIRLDPDAMRRRPVLARMGLAIGLGARSAPAHVLATQLLTAQRLLDALGRRIARRLAR